MVFLSKHQRKLSDANQGMSLAGFLYSFICQLIPQGQRVTTSLCRLLSVKWRRRVVVTALVVSTKLLYVEPG